MPAGGRISKGNSKADEEAAQRRDGMENGMGASQMEPSNQRLDAHALLDVVPPFLPTRARVADGLRQRDKTPRATKDAGRRLDLAISNMLVPDHPKTSADL